jgi:hypothetical protein
MKPLIVPTNRFQILPKTLDSPLTPSRLSLVQLMTQSNSTCAYYLFHKIENLINTRPSLAPTSTSNAFVKLNKERKEYLSHICSR